MSWPRRVAVFLATGVVIYLGLAGALILSQPAGRGQPGEGGLDFGRLARPQDQQEPETWTARDGTGLRLRHFAADRAGAPLLVILHGSGGHGGSYAGLGAELARRGAAEVLIPDLRGHGKGASPRGDLDYIGQFEDDLKDLVADWRAPGQALILLGHSSGGGLAIRAVGGGLAADGVVLLAPFLQYDAPTMRDNSGGWAYPLTRRIIGLSMLNAVGITGFNGLPAILFNMPEGWRDMGMTDRYSYRLNVSFSPRRDWQAEVAALPPFLLIAGQRDEAFRAEAYAPTLSALSENGSYAVLPGLGHLDIISDPAVAARVAGFLRQYD